MAKFVRFKVVLTLVATNVIVIVALLAVSFSLLQRRRFAPTTFAYVMFDNKTAQACSSHPNPRAFDELYKRLEKMPGVKQSNEILTDPTTNNLPFCSELK